MGLLTKHDKKLRGKIADEVAEKMLYMHTCPNERDIILRIIDPYNHWWNGDLHCYADCDSHPNCEVKRDGKQENGRA